MRGHIRRELLVWFIIAGIILGMVIAHFTTRKEPAEPEEEQRQEKEVGPEEWNPILPKKGEKIPLQN
jgi:hypothetical protein